MTAVQDQTKDFSGIIVKRNSKINLSQIFFFN